jgi:hypothetical protein
MLWVGFERTIPAFELAKTMHALDRSATVTGRFPISAIKYELLFSLKHSLKLKSICSFNFILVLSYVLDTVQFFYI